GYDSVSRKLAAYDAYHPMTKIPNFFLDFDAYTDPSNPVGTKINDGKDVLFGDTGNDWLVGGTNNDDLFGGYGDDLLNLDDNPDTHGGTNDQPDAAPFNDSDRAFGGAGLDVLIANTGGDRLIDWVGEFNTYLVPFSPFGARTISRTLEPQLAQFLDALSQSDG